MFPKPTKEPVAPFDQLIKKLADKRKEHGLTASELDAMIGLTDGHIAKYERGYRKPNLFIFHCWVSALGQQVELTPIEKK